MTQELDIFQKTKEVLAGGHWCKNWLETNPKNPFHNSSDTVQRCILGGLAFVHSGDARSWKLPKEADILKEVIKTNFPARVNLDIWGMEFDVANFNNHKETTFADIEFVLDEGSKKLAELGVDKE
jgi:hypothetical protein